MADSGNGKRFDIGSRASKSRLPETDRGEPGRNRVSAGDETRVFDAAVDEDILRFDDQALDDAPSLDEILRELQGDEPAIPAPPKKTGKKNIFHAFADWFCSGVIPKVITIGSAAAVVLILVLVLFSPRPTAQPVTPVDPGEVEIVDYEFVDKGEYEGVLLEQTKDAGSAYVNETLFIGDSNTARINLYGFLGLENVIGVESMAVHEVTTLRCVYFEGYQNPVTIPEAVKLMQPRRIVICFGTNNLTTGTAESFAENYKVALDAIHQAYPYSDIIVAAIPPLGRVLSGTALKQETVDAYNLALIELVKEEGYTFLNISEALKDSTGYIRDTYVIEDGLHISRVGFEMLGKYFRTHSHIVEDTRPALTSIPTRKPAPAKETEGDLDTAEVVKQALSLFYADGFKEPTNETDLGKGTQALFSVPYEQEGGSEKTVAENLVKSVKAQTGLTSGFVSITVRSDNGRKEHIFTIKILPDPSTCTHTFGEWAPTVQNPPACAENTEKRTCSICGFAETRTVEATKEHTFGTATPDASTFPACTGGTQSHTCSVCGFKENIVLEPTTAHSVKTWTIRTAATCTAEGVQEGLCSLCNKTVTQAIAATGHSFSGWQTIAGSQVAPTCGAAGSEKQERICSVCGTREEQTVTLPATGSHTDGNGDLVCDVCGAAMPGA